MIFKLAHPCHRPLRRWVPCTTCNSFGQLKDGRLCPTCRGYGQKWVD